MTTAKSPQPTPYKRLCLAVALGMALWPTWAAAQQGCDDRSETQKDLQQALQLPAKSTDAAALAHVVAGKGDLVSVSRAAVLESADVKAAEWGRSAAQFDIDQVRAGKKPRIEGSATAGIGRFTSSTTPSYGARGVGSLGLSLSAPLYDGGRIDALTRQREELFGASSATLESVRERVTLDTVLTVLERNRFRTQLGVLERHVSKLTCLSNLIDKIVEADRGRASEQVQARNSLRQAELVRDQLAAALRSADTRLQSMLGGQVQAWSAAGLPLLEVPALENMVQLIAENPDVRQLQRQAEAQSFAALAAAAERAPQVRLEVGVNSKAQADKVASSSWNTGLTLNYAFSDGGAREATVSAAQARAQAARRTLDQALVDRNKQAGVLHDTALSAYKRADQFNDLLRDSDGLRRATYLQWAQLGRRSLFDLMSAENSHNSLNLDYVNALFDGFAATAQLRHVGGGLLPWLAPDLTPPTSPAAAPSAAATPPPAQASAAVNKPGDTATASPAGAAAAPAASSPAPAASAPASVASVEALAAAAEVSTAQAAVPAPAAPAAPAVPAAPPAPSSSAPATPATAEAKP
jgi:outer membrane protein, adhesin transport system